MIVCLYSHDRGSLVELSVKMDSQNPGPMAWQWSNQTSALTQIHCAPHTQHNKQPSNRGTCMYILPWEKLNWIQCSLLLQCATGLLCDWKTANQFQESTFLFPDMTHACSCMQHTQDRSVHVRMCIHAFSVLHLDDIRAGYCAVGVHTLHHCLSEHLLLHTAHLETCVRMYAHT